MSLLVEVPSAELLIEREVNPGGPSKSRPQGAGIVKRLSQRHHRLAQCLAEGMPPGEAGVVCGYVGSRVSVLQTDPAFQALIEFYAARRQEQFVGAAKKLADVAELAIDVLHDRLEETPDEIGTTTLVEIVKTSADRTGMGPTSKHEHIHAHLTGDQLAQLKQRALSSQRGIVELLPAQQSSDRGSADENSPEAPASQEGQREEGPSV